MDDDGWGISPLEEERSMRRVGREETEPPPPVKNESDSTQMPVPGVQLT